MLLFSSIFSPLCGIRSKITASYNLTFPPLSHVRPVSHTYCTEAEHMSRWWKWLDLDIISSSSLTAALIGFDIAYNHLVRTPAATAPSSQIPRCKSSEMSEGVRLSEWQPFYLNFKSTFIYLLPLLLFAFFFLFFKEGCWDKSLIIKRHTHTHTI